MLWSKWKAGPQADVSGRVLVSFTDFTANGFLDLPGAVRRLRAACGLAENAGRGRHVALDRTLAEALRFAFGLDG